MKLYKPDEKTLEDVCNRFTYHKPNEDQVQRYELIREQAKQLAVDILHYCPLSRERSLALTKLEEAVMHANSAIARNK